MTLGRQKPYLSFVADALWGTHDRSRSLIMPLGATCYYDASKKQETPSGVLMVVGLVAPEKRWLDSTGSGASGCSASLRYRMLTGPHSSPETARTNRGTEKNAERFAGPQ